MSDREHIAELAAAGLAPRTIAVELGLAGPTVDHHLRRLRDDVVEQAAEPRQVGTRAEVARLLALGMSKLAIARARGLSKSTVSYHARRLGEPVDERAPAATTGSTCSAKPTPAAAIHVSKARWRALNTATPAPARCCRGLTTR